MTPEDSAVSIFGYDGVVRYASLTIATLLGYLPEEMIGQSFRRFVPRAHLRTLVHDWARLTAAGSPGGEVYVRLLTRDGEILPASMHVSPIPGRDEFLVYYRGVSSGRDQLAALNTVLTALSSTLKLSQVLDLILEQLTRVVPGQYSAILLMHADRIRPVRARGHDLEAFQRLVKQHEWMRLANIRRIRETLRPVIINDTQNETDWLLVEGHESVRSWIGIPLLYKGRFLGILQVSSEQPNAFTIADASAALLFAQQAASAIRHAQLYRATRTRASRLKALNDIGVALSRLDISNVIKVVYQSVASLMNCDIFYVALYDPEFKMIRMIHAADRGNWIQNIEQRPLTGLIGYVMKRRERLVIGDAERDGYPVPAVDYGVGDDPRTVVIVPLIAHDEVIGVLSVQSYQPDKYNPADIHMLEAIASQTAVAIRNAQLYDETAERLAALASLQHTSLRLSERMDIPAIVNLIAEEVMQLLGPDDVRIYLYDQRFIRLSLALARSTDGRSAPRGAPLPGSMVETVAAGGAPLVINNQPDHPMLKMQTETTIHTMVGHPIRRSGCTYGALILSYDHPYGFRHEQGRTLSLLLNRAASAIESALHSAEVSRRLEEMSALYQVAHQVSRRLELSDILRDVTYTLHSIFPCRACMIALQVGDSEEIRVRAVAGLPLEAVAHLRFQMGEGVLGQVMQSGKRLYIPDLYAQDSSFVYDSEVRSLLVVPLSAHHHVLGALAIDSAAYEAFTPDHERILAIAASQIAASIDNARLYQEARERAQSLAEANQELQALDRLRDELVQNLSHELRTPLAFVKGYVGLLRSGDLGAINDQQAEALDVIEQKSETISRLITDIMTLETLDADSLHRTRLDLNKLANQAIIGAEITHKGGNLCFKFADAEEPLPVIGDPDRLNQVLDNLIGNAAKFSPEGGCISVRAWAEADYCHCSVADEGIGIPADKLKHIFERFYQVDGSLRRRFGGAGLGLAIVQRIVQAHGGSVRVESELGKGSTFFIVLPRAGSANALQEIEIGKG